MNARELDTALDAMARTLAALILQHRPAEHRDAFGDGTCATCDVMAGASSDALRTKTRVALAGAHVEPPGTRKPDAAVQRREKPDEL